MLDHRNFRAKLTERDLRVQELPKAKRGDPFFLEIHTVRVLIGKLNRARREGYSIEEIADIQQELAKARAELEAARGGRA